MIAMQWDACITGYMFVSRQAVGRSVSPRVLEFCVYYTNVRKLVLELGLNKCFNRFCVFNCIGV